MRLVAPFFLMASVAAAAVATNLPSSGIPVSRFPGHAIPEQDYPIPPAQVVKSFTVPDDLEIELVLAEPVIRQPLFLNFDERGRMWVVQYLQYPAPAGLNVISKDQWWRAVYDKIPEPPPRGVRGLDKITIHEDTDGDGVFDKHKTFVDGLNIATACVKGRSGLWVLNPPYLLFYPDKDDDDVPDGPPAVHLSGFGLEDTHSVVNSLRWGPDGWLYAAQGSTVTGNVRVVAPGSADTNRVFYSQGQNIWRYHPEKHIYEVFSEGGGNAFGVEFDERGRLFSGHNGGDTRGFHYMQGAYLRKGFEKHGELANPYTFGYFPQMDGTKGERFTHNFVIYRGGALPSRYDGKLFGIEPLQGRVVLSEITPDGSTFKTRDLERVVTSRDSWFRPVDIKVGPDGAIYIADWHDRQVTHTRNQDGLIDKETGRIYRLKRKGAKPEKQVVVSTLGPSELLSALADKNRWRADTALRLLGDRADKDEGSKFMKLAQDTSGELALPALWAGYVSGGFSEDEAGQLMEHRNPDVRLWTIRLCGDERVVSANVSKALVQLASRETNVEVRAQLACTAKRLPAADALPIVAALALRDEDARDPRVPLLLWWTIESKCASDREAVLKLFEDSPFWSRPIVEDHLLERVMRRFAATGARVDLLACARLLELAPGAEHRRRLMRGFEEAFKGRSLTGLPDELIDSMQKHNVGSPALRLRQGDAAAVQETLRVMSDDKASAALRLQFIEILGEAPQPDALPALLEIIARSNSTDAHRSAALHSLLAYSDPAIGGKVVEAFPKLAPEVRAVALTLLSSRAAWSVELARAVRDQRISSADVPRDVVSQMRRHRDPALASLLETNWPAAKPTSADAGKRFEHFQNILREGAADPYAGRNLFNSACAGCHRLFAGGGQVGPDLTSYQRSDLAALLRGVVDPSAEIREGYEAVNVETKDERSLTGFIVERNDHLVILRGLDGRNVPLARTNVAELQVSGTSLMPEGLLDQMTPQQVRDLFAYLRSTQPLTK
jgi:putative membrane-bound dehydrogenase-like protein